MPILFQLRSCPCCNENIILLHILSFKLCILLQYFKFEVVYYPVSAISLYDCSTSLLVTLVAGFHDTQNTLAILDPYNTSLGTKIKNTMKNENVPKITVIKEQNIAPKLC